MSIKPSIYMVMVSNIRVFFIFIVTKIECWPLFKQDPKSTHAIKIGNIGCLFYGKIKDSCIRSRMGKKKMLRLPT